MRFGEFIKTVKPSYHCDWFHGYMIDLLEQAVNEGRSAPIGVFARILEAVQPCGRAGHWPQFQRLGRARQAGFSGPDRRKSRQTVAISPYIEGAARAL